MTKLYLDQWFQGTTLADRDRLELFPETISVRCLATHKSSKLYLYMRKMFFFLKKCIKSLIVAVVVPLS